MRPTISLSLAVVLMTGAAHLAAQGVPAAPLKDIPGLAATRASYMRLYAAGDAAGLAMLFSPDATVDEFGAPRMKGRAQIEAGLKAAFGMQTPKLLEIVPVSVTETSSTVAAEGGTYHQMDTAKGKAVHIWGRYVISAAKDTAGTWHLQYLMGFPDSTKTDK